MRYTLIHEGREIPIHHTASVIGRSPTCEIVVDHPSVSRKHARLAQMYDSMKVYDLDSPNGIYVNDKRIVGSHTLRSGDVIRIGEQELHFVAVNDDASPPPPSRNEDDEEVDALVGDDMTMVNDVTALLCTGARRMLDAGEVDRAQAVLKTRWRSLNSRGHSLHPALAVFAARTGLRMAAATKRPFWADDAVILLAAADTAPDAETLEDIERAADVVGMTSAIRTYLNDVAKDSNALDAQAKSKLIALQQR